MTLQQLLNADHRTIARWIRLGLSWWSRELAELTPPALRRRNGRTARWTALLREQGTVELWRDGVADGALTQPLGAVRRADLILAPGEALVRDLDLPRLSASDLRRLIELNIDRYTPFRAEQVYFDVAAVDRTAEGPRQRVRLGLILRDRAQDLLSRADVLGLSVQRMGPGGGPDGRTLELDFMRAVRADQGGDLTSRRRSYLWLACGVLAAACVLVAVLRDLQDVDQLQHLVDTQQPTVALALKLRRSVQIERARRLNVLTRRSAHEPLRILDAATKALPPGQWVQRFEWNGRVVRLVGFKQPGFNLVGALNGPALANTRSLLSDMSTRTPGGQEPFDVMADAANGNRR